MQKNSNNIDLLHINQTQNNRDYISMIALTASMFALYFLFDAIMPFIIGLFLSYCTLPIVNLLSNKYRLNRAFVCFVVVALVFVLINYIFFIAIPLLAIKFMGYLSHINIPNLIDKVAVILNNILSKYLEQRTVTEHDVYNLRQSLMNILSNAMPSLVSASWSVLDSIVMSSGKLINILTIIFVSPMITFYMLKDWESFKKSTIEIFPMAYQDKFRTIISNISDRLTSYVLGQLLVCTYLGLFYAILLTIVQLHMGFIIGFIMGLISFIPYIGFIIGLVTSTSMAMLQFNDINKVFVVMGILVIGQIIEGNFVTPKVMGKSMNIHPNWIVFSLFASIIVFGPIGALFALPLTAIFATILAEIFRNYQKSEYYCHTSHTPI